MRKHSRVVLAVGVLAIVGAFGASAPAAAQPFVSWMHVSGPTSGYLDIAHTPALNPTSAITIEAWVKITDPGGCSSIIGKNWQTAWWVGICGTTVRSYVRGYNNSGVPGEFSFRNGGEVPPGQWTHVAVVFDGSHRIHYVNGEQVGSFAETSGLTTNTAHVRIASDVNFVHTPLGEIDEVRVWNVGRSQAEIRAAINVPLSSGTGLVSVWHLDGNTFDPVGGHSGTITGSGVSGASFATVANCGSSSTSQLCLGSRFLVKGTFRTGAPGTPEGNASVVVAGADSGIFWFFDSSNWEVMIKALNACGLNSRYWIFSAATTNVHYRLEVLDVTRGRQKIYFNYPGPPAPAVTDTDAFATCP